MHTITEFTKKERGVIAEYLYSFEQDILIKDDKLQLIDVLSAHEIIHAATARILKDDVHKGSLTISDELSGLITANIPEHQLLVIMKEYFGTN